MRRNGRWWLAGALTLVAFLIITWGVTRYLPASLLKDPTQRLTVGSGAGLAVAGLVALWGKSFATQERDARSQQPEREPAASGSLARHAVTIKGDSTGIASAGDRVGNVQRPQASRSIRPKISHGPGFTPEKQAPGNAEVWVEGTNSGIVSAGDDTTNIQETH